MQLSYRMLCLQHLRAPDCNTFTRLQQKPHPSHAAHPCIQILPACRPPCESHETNVAVRSWIEFLALSDNAPSPEHLSPM